MRKDLSKMTMIKPPKEYLDGSGFEKDNLGLFPMYIYNAHLYCHQIKYKVFIIYTANQTHYMNDTDLDCKINPYYNDSHHFFSDELKATIYDLFDKNPAVNGEIYRIGI